tara:strand:- start:63 stop:332 length:270 start_codon:yes stop_codon:yes gene_type:complete
MDLKNIKLSDWVFIIVETIMVAFGLFIIIGSQLDKSEAKRRKFEEATDITQQMYFQELQLIASIEMIFGALILVLASMFVFIYFKIIKK